MLSRILVDIDAMAASQLALETAVHLAAAAHAELHIVDVYPDPASWDRHTRTQRLNAIARLLKGVPVNTASFCGPTATVLASIVDEGRHDLLIRSRLRDVGAAPGVDTCLQVLQQCPCAVWVLGPGALGNHPRIALTVDASVVDEEARRLNHRVIEFGLLIARLLAGSVTVVQAWRPVAEKKVYVHASRPEFAAAVSSNYDRAATDLRALAATYGPRLAGARLDLRKGAVEKVIPKLVASDGIDVVVAGAVRRTGLSRLLFGSTAERLLECTPCSVLAVKPADSSQPRPLAQTFANLHDLP